MGVCCSFNRIDNSLQHGLNENINNNELVVIENQNQQLPNVGNNDNNNNNNMVENNESSLNTMSVTISAVTDHPIEDNEDDNSDDNESDSKYTNLLNRMHRRKNLKSYLTQVKKSKTKQCITKRKKLKELLLDKSNEKEYKTAFDKTVSPNAPKFEKLSYKTVFPEIIFTEWIICEGNKLNDIINDIFDFNHIPLEISIIIHTYTCDLLPGIYSFIGHMDYNGIDSENENDKLSNNNNHCQCEIILSSRSEIIGGYFCENSFKYYITNGSYTYTHPLYIEFTKEYFNYNYKYKVYGNINNINNKLQLKGYWKLLDDTNKYNCRSGNIKMDYINKKQINNKLISGTYNFYGHCDYLPNTKRRNFLIDKQKIKCHLTLKKNYNINGKIKLLNDINYSLFDDINSNNNENVFEIDEMESEWDIYGGIHIQLINGYIMEGFFNGYDFMGVWKDFDLERFGHFQYELFKENDNNCLIQRNKSLDSDDDIV